MAWSGGSVSKGSLGLAARLVERLGERGRGRGPDERVPVARALGGGSGGGAARDLSGALGGLGVEVLSESVVVHRVDPGRGGRCVR